MRAISREEEPLGGIGGDKTRQELCMTYNPMRADMSHIKEPKAFFCTTYC
jgi:hypothetical protein